MYDAEHRFGRDGCVAAGQRGLLEDPRTEDYHPPNIAAKPTAVQVPGGLEACMPERKPKPRDRAQTESKKSRRRPEPTERRSATALFNQVRFAIRLNAHRQATLRGKLAEARAAFPTATPADQAGQLVEAWKETSFVRLLGLHFWIDQIAPEELMEGRKARVYFSIWNVTGNTYTDLTVTANVLPQFFPYGVNNVTSYGGLSAWTIPVLVPFQSLSGVLTFVVPPASKREANEPPPNTLLISLDQFQQPTQEQLDQAHANGFELFGSSVNLATDSARFDSGARYRVAMTGLTIKSIASGITDTVVVAVSGSVAGAAIEAQTEELGDHGAGRGEIPVHLPGIGYFDSVADGNGDQFILTTTVANAGVNYDDVRTVLDWLSRISAAGATAATATILAPVWAGIEVLTEYLNSFIGNCNRVVVPFDQIALGCFELWAWTYDDNQLTEVAAMLPAPEYVVAPSSGEASGCQVSKYIVSHTIFRDRTGREYLDVGDADPTVRDYPEVIHLGYGQKLALVPNLSADNLASGLAAAKPLWTKEAGDGKLNKDTFFAPQAGPYTSTFAVVTLQMMLEGQVSGNGFVVIRFD